MNTHHNNFTLIRLVLALMVVLGHFKILPGDVHAGGIFGYADFAVDAFFITSGYLVFASFDRQPSVGSFYIRRMFRIYPLYAVTVLLQGLGMAIIAGGLAAHVGELLRYLALNLVFANFLAPGLGGLLDSLHNHGINPSLWTLKIEVAFYFTLPLLWYLTRRWGLWCFILLYVASTVFAAIALHYGADNLAKQLPGKIRFFVVGMALCRHRDSLNIPVKQAVIIALLLFGVCSLRHSLPLFAVYPLCVGMLLYICAICLPAVPLKFDISYGVYLFHGPLIQFALLLHLFKDTTGFLCLLLVSVCGLAYVAEQAIELPGIKLGHFLSLRRANRHSVFSGRSI